MNGIALPTSYCDAHAKALCDGATARGLGSLIGRRRRLAAMPGEVQGRIFEPLDIADWMLVTEATNGGRRMPAHLRLPRALGVRAIVANPEGSARCVCCEVDRRRGPRFGMRWIVAVLEQIAEVARREGLIRGGRTSFGFSLVSTGG